MDYYIDLLERYRDKGVLIDTSLLLLLCIGGCDQDRIEKFKRTKIFTVEDYKRLSHIARRFKKIVTTPCILTEVSNYIGQLPEDIQKYYYNFFSESVNQLEEEYTPSAELAAQDFFKKYGLTDASIIHRVKGKYLVLTTDFPLAGYLKRVGADVINFNHIRTINWFQNQ